MRLELRELKPRTGAPLTPMWEAKGRPGPAQLQPPARQFPGGGGTHGLQLLQPVLHPGAQTPRGR